MKYFVDAFGTGAVNTLLVFDFGIIVWRKKLEKKTTYRHTHTHTRFWLNLGWNGTTDAVIPQPTISKQSIWSDNIIGSIYRARAHDKLFLLPPLTAVAKFYRRKRCDFVLKSNANNKFKWSEVGKKCAQNMLSIFFVHSCRNADWQMNGTCSLLH